jgi:uncharacterized protein YbdZ (MbtH family)
MSARFNIPRVFGVAVVMTSALRCWAPRSNIPSASADPCPDSEEVLARDTNEQRRLRRRKFAETPAPT